MGRTFTKKGGPAMEISTNELLVLIVLAVFCWKLREWLDEAERRAKQQLHSLTSPADERGSGHPATSGAHLPPNDVSPGSIASRLRDVERADRSFDAKWFLESAGIAYEKIITAFAQADRTTLRALLADDVYETFAREIEDRESRDEHVEFTFIRLKRSEISDAGVFDGLMQIVVSFESEIVMATRNSAGFVVAGEPAKLMNTSDLWTFVKENPESPVWKLARTESPSKAQASASEKRVLQVSGA
jgi:predicted lipid-binding transport protein (Tim44 family)